MRFPVKVFQVQSVTSFPNLLRSFHDYVKVEAYGARFGKAILWNSSLPSANEASYGIGQLTITPESNGAQLRVSMREQIITDDAFALIELARSEDPHLARLEQAALRIKDLTSKLWTGFSRMSHGNTPRQLWLFALDAIESKDRSLAYTFESNIGAKLEDIVSTEGMKLLLSVIDFHKSVGCLPSAFDEKLDSDLQYLVQMAVGTSLAMEYTVYEITSNSHIKPLIASPYLNTVYFLCPKHFDATRQKPWELFNLCLLNPLSFCIQKAPELYEAQLEQHGYRKSIQGLYSLLEHDTQPTLVGFKLPHAMCDKLKRFADTARKTSSSRATQVAQESTVEASINAA